MSETIKLIIEIPKAIYECVKEQTYCGSIYPYLEMATPLDNDSDRAEVQAYFEGEAYGWEEGRKALINDIKAEIEKNAYPIVHGVNNHEKGMTLYGILQVLDNIGKGDSK